jgi:septin family protein
MLFFSLKALDVVTMRELAKRVNVIPVIAKADTTCKDELSRFKQKVVSRKFKIFVHKFPHFLFRSSVN